MQDKLCLYTASFPYGKMETFLEAEIEELAKVFKEIYVFPLSIDDGKLRDVPSNVKVQSLDALPPKPKTRFVFQLAKWLNLERKTTINPTSFKQNWKYLRSQLLQNIVRADQLSRYLNTNKLTSAAHYSYWLDEWSTVLSILKKKRTIESYHSRAHGFDVYDERHQFGFIPFRFMQLDGVETVSCVSDNGTAYLKEIFPKFASKIRTSRLGTAENNQLNPLDNNQITLVSCATIIPLKRNHLIAEMLTHFTQSVKWVHFGDGPLEKELKEQCKDLPNNISVEFKGRVSNSEVHEFYKSNSVSMLLNVSEYEGLPVSMMEAISYGIPLLGTDVGGVKEIVNEKTGILLHKDFDPKKAAEQVKGFIESEKNTAAHRENIQQFWQENFSAATNFSKFAQHLKGGKHD